MQLSLLCVTKAESHLLPLVKVLARVAHETAAECVIVTDGPEASARIRGSELMRIYPIRHAEVRSTGFLESVLDEAVAACRGDYVLRLDDDECPSVAMVRWLLNGKYLAAEHWKFPRMHLWPDVFSMLDMPHLWPDHQTRLSVKAKAGGRHTIHAPSPFGNGELAPVAIEHLKFLVRSREEREKTAAAWHSGPMRPFSLPEDAYSTVRVLDAGTGAVPWVPKWVKETSMRPGVSA